MDFYAINSTHVIGVCLPSQSGPEKHDQEKKAHKPLRTLCICRLCLKSCSFEYYYSTNRPFTCSGCLICVSCSVHMISTYCVRKGP